MSICILVLTFLILASSFTTISPQSSGTTAGDDRRTSSKAHFAVRAGWAPPAYNVVIHDFEPDAKSGPMKSGTADRGPLAPSSVNKSEPLYTINTTIGFQGLRYGCNQDTYCTSRVPPDVQVASGSKYVLEMVNSLGEIWDKQGNRVKTFPLAALFLPASATPHLLFDPRVLYDASSQRWFAAVADKDNQTVRFAASQTDDPTGDWWSYHFTLTSGTWADQPLIGTSGDKLVVSLNDYSLSNASFVGAEYWVINKAEVLSGSALHYFTYGPDSTIFSVHPAKASGSNDTIYMVSVRQSKGYIELFRVDGTPPLAGISTFQIPVSAITSPPNATQFGSDLLVDTGDTRVMDAVWANGVLWLSFTDGCIPHGDSQTRSCLRLLQLDTDKQKILQNFLLDAVGYYYFYPTLSLDSAQDLVVGFGYSSSNDDPSFAVWARPPISPNAISAPLALRLGTAPETGSCNEGVCRYGDYFGSAVDPQTGSVWLAGEFSNQSGWSTYVTDVIVRKVPTTVPISLKYQILGAGSGYSLPTLSYYLNGSALTDVLSATPTTYNVDVRTQLSITPTLVGSTATERWTTNQTTWEIGKTPENITLYYFHQYFATVNWLTSDGSKSTPPELTITQLGVQRTVSLVNTSSTFWVDGGSQWVISKVLSSSNNNPQERWYTSGPTNGSVTEHFGSVIQYLHQFHVSVSGDPERGGTASPPSAWYNSGAFLQLVSTANPGWQFEGWTGNGLSSYTGSKNSVNLTVNGPVSEVGRFFPGVTITSGQGGSVSYSYGVKSGVLNESATNVIYVPPGTNLTLSASSSSSILTPFRSWSGNVTTTTSSSISLVVDSPLAVKAEFGNNYPLVGLIVLMAIVVLTVAAGVRRSRRRGKTQQPSAGESSTEE